MKNKTGVIIPICEPKNSEKFFNHCSLITDHWPLITILPVNFRDDHVN